MSTWRYEEALAMVAGLQVYGASGSEYRQALRNLAHILSEAQVAWRVTVSVLSRGVVMAMALGRCSLAEKEHDDRYWEYWEEVVESAQAVRAAWEGMEQFCRSTGSDCDQLMLACPVRDVVRTVTDMAEAVLRRDDQLLFRRRDEQAVEEEGPARTGLAERAHTRIARAEAYAGVLQGDWKLHQWEG
jgi:hypothetical protein